MPLSLPSDVVLNVARAAEPASPSRETLRTASGRAAGQSRETPETFVKFEAMVLQTFMQSILPKDTESAYGGGMAGDMWKSLLAQQLGEVMAQRGGIGIADRVLGDHYLDGEDKVPLSGVSQGPDKTSGDEGNILSAALVDKMQRNILKNIGEDLPAMTAGR